VPKIAQALPEKATAAPAKPRKVLAFTYATGFYHSSIPVCARATQMLGDKTGAWKTVIRNDRFMSAAQPSYSGVRARRDHWPRVGRTFPAAPL
jgi:hypothetical protein